MPKWFIAYLSEFPLSYLLSHSVWTEESVCIVLNSTIVADVNCSYSCGSDCWRASKYPCLQIYVSVNNTGRVSLLSHNEETQEANSEVHSLDTLPALIAGDLITSIDVEVAMWYQHSRLGISRCWMGCAEVV